MYRKILKPVFFLMRPERAHYLAMDLLKTGLKIPLFNLFFKVSESDRGKRPVRLWGLEFPNPVGLAAGFDKDAKWIDHLAALGFGFIEIGTVTPLAQPGNEKPRLFRLPKDQGLINRMGFNNDGSKAAAKRLAKKRSSIIIGGNIGKNKVTPNENAVNDYLLCYHDLYPYVDYFVVNVSSPNTPGLRELQDKKPLLGILSVLQQVNTKQEKPKPILLKIAPDLTDAQLDDIVEIVRESKIQGVVATNTTISRDGLSTPSSEVENIGAGGLSGLPVKDRSTEVIRYLHQKSQGKFPIIGVGGIFNAEDAKEKLDAGASLVQVYTGFIYEGPGIVKNILRGL